MDGVFPDDEPPTSGSRSPLSAKLAAYSETLALEQRLKLVEGAKGKVGDENAENKEALVSPTFIREGGRRSGSPHVRYMHILEPLASKSMNPSLMYMYFAIYFIL